MNRTYRSIWNQALGAWVATSELASARGKPGKAKLLGAATLAAVSLVHSHAAYAQYFPDGGTASSAGAIAIGSSSSATGINATAIGTGANVSVGSSGAFGAFATATGVTAVAVGTSASATGLVGASAFGSSASATGGNSLAVGSAALASGVTSTAVGSRSTASGTASIAIGVTSTSSGAGATAIGQSASATAANAIAFGTGSSASYANSVAIGAGSVTGMAAPTGTGYLTGAAAPLSVVSVGSPTALRRITNVADGSAPQDAVTVSQLQVVASDAVMYDSNSHTSVTLGGVGAASAVALTNIAAGAITATSTDAVNGSQLFALETQIGTLGGQVTQMSQTTTTGASSSSPSNSKYVAVNSTGSAASATGTESVAIGGNSTASSSNGVAVGSGSQATGAGSSAVGANAVASAANSVALGAGSVASEANSVSVGSPGNERTITNVAPGVNPTDAVNMSQLNSVQNSVNSVARTAYSGIAAATALTMIPEVDQGKTLSVGIGMGNYQGYSAVAIGFTARVAQNLKVKGGVSVTDAGTVYGAGVGYQW